MLCLLIASEQVNSSCRGQSRLIEMPNVRGASWEGPGRLSCQKPTHGQSRFDMQLW